MVTFCKWKIRWSKVLIFFIFLAVFVFIWRLNALTPLWADDYCRVDSSRSLVESLRKAVIKFNENEGRVFTNTVNYFVFGNYPKTLKYFNFLNAAMFCVLVYLIFYLSFGHKPGNFRDSLFLLFIFSLVFVGSKGIGEVVLWKTGSIGYLWGVVLELSVLVPYFSFLRSGKKMRSNLFILVLFLVLCFVAATFIEHLSFAVSILLRLLLYEAAERKIEVPSVLKFAALAHWGGSLLLLLSKGNLMKSVQQTPLPLNLNFLSNVGELGQYLKGPLELVFIILFIVALSDSVFRENIKHSILWYLFFLATAIFLIFAFIPTEQPFNFRIAFPFEVVVIIAITYLSGFLPKIRLLELTILGILVTTIAVHGFTAYINAGLMRTQVNARAELIERMKKKGVKNISVVPVLWPTLWGSEAGEYISKYNYKSDITQDPLNWKNTCFAQAYGLESAVILSK